MSAPTKPCWRCGGPVAGGMFCPACQAIQALPPDADFFSILGLARSPAIDTAALEHRYYELSRRVHPDRHQTGNAVERQASAHNAALINRAYRTLRDPVERGLYWLRLHGESVSADNKRVPPEIAELVFSVQEDITRVRTGDRRAREALGQARLAVAQRHGELLGALDGVLAKGGNLSELKPLLAEIAYVRTLLRDVDRGLEA